MKPTKRELKGITSFPDQTKDRNGLDAVLFPQEMTFSKSEKKWVNKFNRLYSVKLSTINYIYYNLYELYFNYI